MTSISLAHAFHLVYHGAGELLTWCKGPADFTSKTKFVAFHFVEHDTSELGHFTVRLSLAFHRVPCHLRLRSVMPIADGNISIHVCMMYSTACTPRLHDVRFWLKAAEDAHTFRAMAGGGPADDWWQAALRVVDDVQDTTISGRHHPAHQRARALRREMQRSRGTLTKPRELQIRKLNNESVGRVDELLPLPGEEPVHVQQRSEMSCIGQEVLCPAL